MPKPPAPPALIVRHHPSDRDNAIRETRRILAAIGEPDAIVRRAGVEGHLKIIPEGNPHEAQEKVTRLARDQPDLFQYTSRWTVVDQWVHTDLKEIRRAVASYARDIGATDSWKVAVRPSAAHLHRQAVIDAVAPLIHNAPVDLDNPKKEIRIDILGDETGIGIVPRGERFHLDD